MTVIQFYFLDLEADCKLQIKQCAISDWYCKPSILSMLALKSKALFVTCDKYGCRQFSPDFSKAYPVHCWNILCYKENLPWLSIEFNDNSSNSPWYDVCDFVSKLGFVKYETVNRDNG